MFLLDTHTDVNPFKIDNLNIKLAESIANELTSHITMSSSFLLEAVKLTQAEADLQINEFLVKSAKQIKQLKAEKAGEYNRSTVVGGVMVGCYAVFGLIGYASGSVVFSLLAFWSVIIGIITVIVVNWNNKTSSEYEVIIKRIIRRLDASALDTDDKNIKKSILSIKHKAEDFLDVITIDIRSQQDASNSLANTAIWLSILN